MQQAINFFVRRHLNKQLGKSVILQCQYIFNQYKNRNEQHFEKEADALFEQEKRIRMKQTFYYHPRNLARHYKGKQLRQRRKDIIRHYDQKRVNFFVHNVLAQKRISIPLR